MFTLSTASSGRRKSTSRRGQNHRAMSSESGISERFLIQAWQHLPGRADLVTEEGEPMRLIYPGRETDDRGADIKDAVILAKQGLIKGDIEFHLQSGGWKEHRHHLDPAYNNTILHVVMWPGNETATTLQSGNKVPVLALCKYLERAGRQRAKTGFPASTTTLPCYGAVKSRPMERINEMLDGAGRERFLIKAAAYQSELNRGQPSQILYQGILEALGYMKNKLPFAELACRVPVHHLETMVQRRRSDEECLARQQALLFGTAGLLPSQRGLGHFSASGDHWVEKLERYWSEYGCGCEMPADSWRLVKVRPNNYPVRRIAGISYLMLRHRSQGLLEGLLSLIKGTEIDRAYSALEAAIVVMASGYWERHYDFGGHCRDVAPALVGNSRAAAIAVNVILPFAYAWGRFNAQPELSTRSMTIFTVYPNLDTNAIERHMARQLGRSCVPVFWAQRQQGMIHIYKTLCTQGKCAICPLGMGG